ncbi:class I SAM-dependent methyltransferase [Neorhizobium alkalisoli]|uniref:class I SAM-dependent methyltransferase n=1 Tax=Neorhizobium alkalisoli TaxID=528178 RepID=UPI00131A1191|nr:methyltransferase domain-containing protein [Neorhizobium alkalisoli]
MTWNCNAGGKGRGAGQLSADEALLPATDAAVSDFLHFFRSWISNPLRVAAVAPSGDSLARLMTQDIAPIDGPVIELGPGTGVFTRALLARGVSESDLTLIEYGTEFVPGLQRRFPKARVLQMDAAKLHSGDLFEGQPVGAVVSGLPILSMSPRKVTAILLGAFTYLRPGAAFYQFTYGPRCPVPRPILDRLGLKATHIGGTMRNLPPAAVYKISRRKPLDHLHGVRTSGEEALFAALPAAGELDD